MAADCLHEPPSLAFAKAFGASFVLLAAIAAWFLNNVVQWLVWRYGETRREYELLKGLNAEIKSFSGAEEEGYWADLANADTLIASLEGVLDANQPLAPYLVTYDETVVFDEIKKSLTSLPAVLVEAIIVYYYQTLALSKQLSDFRSDFFARLSRERQKTVIRGAFEVGGTASAARERALRLLALGIGAAEHRGRLLRMGGILAILAAVPTLGLGVQALIAGAIIPAVEWASACDLAPRNADRPDMGPTGAGAKILPQKP